LCETSSVLFQFLGFFLTLQHRYDINDLKFQVPSGSWGSAAAFQEYLQSSFDVLYAEGEAGKPKMMSIGLHCRISGKPGRFAVIENFVKYIIQKEQVWITTRKAIAEHWRETFPYERKEMQSV
jgi:peptidoglycan/xylan/chitin deacetylase (PgdA/CDA1 family)